MFDVQYDGRFGKKEESISELKSILKGIADKLIFEMDIINEYVKLRSIEAHERFGAEKEERAYYTSENMLVFKDRAKEYMYDKIALSDKNKSSQEYKANKEIKKKCQELCNSAGILIMQLDNVVEEIASRAYLNIFEKDPHRYRYREASMDLGIGKDTISNIIIAMRTTRNAICHSSSFIEYFENITVGKIVHLKNMIFTLVAIGNYFSFSIDANSKRIENRLAIFEQKKLKNKSIFVTKIH